MTGKERIIEKIQKLISMANSKSYNEHEAAVATKRVQELLTKHNILNNRR